MNLKFLKNADDCTFNKANILPIINATIGILVTATSITALSTSTLFGSLSEGHLGSLGFTPAVLSVVALTSQFTTIASIQQIYTNRTIEKASGHEDAMLMRSHPDSVAFHDSISVIDLRNGVIRC